MYSINSSFGQIRTVGLLLNDSSQVSAGYTLFSPLKSKSSYLIDINGMLVRSWKSSYNPGQSVRLLPDGSLLRTAMVGAGNPFVQGGVGGRVEKFDWDGKLTWYFEHYGNSYSTHHDVEYMPNGNILLIAWEKKTLSEAIAAGRNTSNAAYNEVWSEKIIEVQPSGSSGGTIVWEWHIWDHLIQDYDPAKSNYGVVSQHPELFDINFGDKNADWLHINAVRYNPERDEIMVSVHSDHEFLVIDHSTTTLEAAGHTEGKAGKGGDLLYRWGNPLAYKSGAVSDQKLFSQHDTRWTDSGLPGAGNILIFNNGTNRPGGAYSSIEEIVPPIAPDGSYLRNPNSAFGPASTTWSFIAQPPASFYALNISGAVRLPNGNTLICEGTKGKFFEVTSAGQIVWTYVNPVNANGACTQGQKPGENLVFKIYRYPTNYSAFVGKDLTPGDFVEKYPASVKDNVNQVPSLFELYQNHPNPFNPVTVISYQIPQSGSVTLKVYDVLGREVVTLVNEFQIAGTYNLKLNAENYNLSSGVYYYRLTSEGLSKTKKIILIK